MMLSDRPRTYPLLDRGLFLGRAHLAQAGQPVTTGQALNPAQNLLQNGAILQVQVSVPSQYQAQGGAAPAQPQTFTAMIDSGASISCINISDAQALNLPQVGATQLGGVGGSSQAPIYGAALGISQYGVNVDPVQIAGVANPLPGVDMLIGRDILKSLNFDYHGAEGVFSLSQDQPGGNAPQTPTTQNQVAAAPPTPGTVPPPPGPAPIQPQQNLPQPPAPTTILGMSPLVAASVGVVGVGAIVGSLFLFRVF